MPDTIIVHLRGGILDVVSKPAGIAVELHDYDIAEDERDTELNADKEPFLRHRFDVSDVIPIAEGTASPERKKIVVNVDSGAVDVDNPYASEIDVEVRDYDAATVSDEGMRADEHGRNFCYSLY